MFVVKPGGLDPVDQIVRQTAPVIRANPGFNFVLATNPDKKDGSLVTPESIVLIRIPVIAWRILPYCGMEPVTPNDDCVLDDWWGAQITATEYPSGVFYDPGSSIFDNEQDFRRYAAFESNKRKNYCL